VRIDRRRHRGTFVGQGPIRFDGLVSLDVVTFGEAMALLLAEPGVPLRRATAFRRQIAGAESNVAVGLARLGHRVGWFGRVGADAFGDAVLATLRAEGIDVSRAVVDDAAPTGLLARDCSADRPTEVAYYRRHSAGSRLQRSDVDNFYVATASWLHVSGVTPVLSRTAAEATTTAVEAARAAGVPVCLDPNVRRRLCPPDEAATVLRPLVGYADVIVAGEDEALLLAGAGDVTEAGDRLLARGARLVVVKRGVRGAWATDGDSRFAVPAFPVRAVDPVGAGDAFAAGLLSALLRQVPVEGALREAAAVAALCVAAPGDLDGLPTAAERDAYLEGGADVAR
jgi:2-dehydro-3-deoxygluconokinase